MRTSYSMQKKINEGRNKKTKGLAKRRVPKLVVDVNTNKRKNSNGFDDECKVSANKTPSTNKSNKKSRINDDNDNNNNMREKKLIMMLIMQVQKNNDR